MDRTLCLKNNRKIVVHLDEGDTGFWLAWTKDIPGLSVTGATEEESFTEFSSSANELFTFIAQSTD